jgi:putative tricarboxylic transport membrane protein
MPTNRTPGWSRVLAAALALVLAAVLAPAPAAAQGKVPTGPIEITVGSSPGGTPDVIMRNVVKIMTEEKIVPNPVVVQNRTGGSWATAYNYVLGKKGDENTLLCIAQPVYTTPIMQGTPSVIDQIVPVAGFIQSELVLLVAPGSPYRTLKDFMEAAKKEPRRIRIAGAQTGGTDHLSTALLEKAGDVKFTYVPFDGGGAAFAAFLGGNVEATFGYVDRFFFDTIAHSPVALRYLIDVVGADRVMLGSDYCFDMGYEDPMAALKAVEPLSDGDRARILGGNALRFLGLG